MAQQIVIEPITRIEGHGKITIQMDSSGKVTDAQVHVTQFRGFEKFCEGRPFYEMPSLVERICGICPISHSLASAKACDAILGVRIPSPFIPGIVVPGLLVTGLVLWPFIERRITHDRREHNLLDWPWDTPMRTATGAAAIALFIVITISGANDVIGILLEIPIELLTAVLRVLVFVVPVVVWVLTYRMAWARKRGRTGGDEHPHGIRLRRTAAGGFEEEEGA